MNTDNNSSHLNDFVRFKNKQKITDIIKILDELKIEYSIGNNTESHLEYIGFADGNDLIPNTLSFVDGTLDYKLSDNSLYISDHSIENKNNIIVSDPRFAFIKLLQVYKKSCMTIPSKANTNEDQSSLYSRNKIHDTAILENDISIGENNIISAGVILKRGTIIGNNCIIRENTVVGGAGIALYVSKENGVLRYPHLGGVEIRNNVEIGCNVSIMRGILNTTFIGNDVVIGNLSNIGHGCKIKEKVWISVGCLIGGHTEIEKQSTIGLGVNIKNALIIKENSSVGMGAVVTKNTAPNSSYFGNPARQMKGLKTGPNR